MLELPPKRKTWQCGYRWDNELKEYVDTKNGCGQWIYQSDTEFYESGKGKIINLKYGRGGAAGEAHKCHNTGFHGGGPADGNWDRYWAEYHVHRMNEFCGICCEHFNSYKVPLCPNCFKLACRACDNKQVWIVKEGVDNNICNKCGHSGTDVIQVFFIQDRLEREQKKKEVIDPLA